MRTINLMALLAGLLAAVVVKTTCQGLADKVDQKATELVKKKKELQA